MTQTRDATAELLKLVEEWNRANVDHDRATLERLLADGLHYVHSSGMIQDKSANIEATMARGRNQNLKDMQVRVFGDTGDTAVLTAVMVIDPTEPGAAPRELQIMQVWTKEHGAWKMAARQAMQPH